MWNDPHVSILIVICQLRLKQLANFAAVLESFDLRYSLHSISRLNLAYDPRLELCNQIMRSQIEICRAIHATCLVYHSGLQSLEAIYHGYGGRRSLYSDAELSAGALREQEALRMHARMAADADMIIGVENGVPVLWEYELIEKFGQPRSELVKHDPALHLRPILRQLESIDHPNVALALDVGHLLVAAKQLGFDFLAAIEASPWVRHLHLSDNFGQLEQGSDQEDVRIMYGESDLHLPPGWGSIPFGDVFARLPNYEGALVLEIKASFRDHLDECLQNTRKFLAASRVLPP
jgi:sugar phosphate isomerase/epimerase